MIMDWILIIGFILLGIVLIIIELVFVPGTTIVGIGGFICAAYGIYVSFETFGNTTGFWTLGVTLLISLGVTIYALKTNSWERFSLKDSMDGKFNEDFKLDLQVGEEGESISSLKPIGKAVFRDKEIEVRSSGDYVRESQKVRITKIIDNKIFVETITES